MQSIQGDAGLLLMPSGFALVLAFPTAGRLSDRLSPGVLIGSGLMVFAYSFWLTSHVDVHIGFWSLAWWTVLSRIGLGLVFPVLSAGELRALPPELLAQGSEEPGLSHRRHDLSLA